MYCYVDKMTIFLPSEGVSEITFGSICSRSLWSGCALCIVLDLMTLQHYYCKKVQKVNFEPELVARTYVCSKWGRKLNTVDS